MNREMRRQERVLDESRMQELLLTGEYGVLSTTSIGGYAYGVPMSYVYKDETLYFHCSPVGHKVDNLISFPLVSFCIVGNTKVSPAAFTTGYESIIVFGIIESIEVEEEKRDALRLIVKKYSPGYKEEGDAYIDRAIQKTKVLKLTIKKITGKGRQL